MSTNTPSDSDTDASGPGGGVNRGLAHFVEKYDDLNRALQAWRESDADHGDTGGGDPCAE